MTDNGYNIRMTIKNRGVLIKVQPTTKRGLFQILLLRNSPILYNPLFLYFNLRTLQLFLLLKNYYDTWLHLVATRGCFHTTSGH